MSTSHAPTPGVQVPPPVFFSKADVDRVKDVCLTAYNLTLNATQIAAMFALDPVTALGVAAMLEAAADKLYVEARIVREICRAGLVKPDKVICRDADAEACLKSLDAKWQGEIGGSE